MNNVFKSKFPTWDAVAALSPKELAYEIAIGMNQKMRMRAEINWDVNGLAEAIASAYADTPENRRIVMEGIHMMFALGLLTESGTRGGPFIYLSRAGRAVQSNDDAKAHRSYNFDAYSLLDERIRQAVWTPYLKGDYDIAIAYAFKRVEVSMREKGDYPSDLFAERLIKRFFKDFRLPGTPDETKQAKQAKLTSEEQFFIGASDLYRNSATHQDDTIGDPERAMEVLLIANHQLHLVRSAVRRTQKG